MRTRASWIPRQSLTLSKYGDVGDWQEMLPWLVVCSKQHTHLAQELRKVKEDFQPELEELLLGCDSMPTRGASRSVKLAGAAAVPGPGSTSESEKNGYCFASLFQTRRIFSCGKLKLGTRQRRTFWEI